MEVRLFLLGLLGLLKKRNVEPQKTRRLHFKGLEKFQNGLGKIIQAYELEFMADFKQANVI